MGVKLILAGLTLAAVAVVGCESHHHDHHHSRGDYRNDRIGYDTGGYYRDGYYDRNGRYHDWDHGARPAGARVDPKHDHDWDHDHDRDHDRDHDGRDNRYRQWDPSHSKS